MKQKDKTMTNYDAISSIDDRQPHHMVDGKLLTQSEWKEKVKKAIVLFDMFKRCAYRAKEL